MAARNVPASEPPAVGENVVAAEASIIADSIAANRPPAIGNMPITEAPVLAEHVGAELLEEPHKEVPEQVSEIAAANSISEIAEASSEAGVERTAAAESEAPVEIEPSNAPPHVPPLEEVTVAPDVEVEAVPIAEPSLGIPRVAAMAAAYEDPASRTAAQPAAANSSAPVLGPQLVKNVRPTPAMKSFAKP